VSEIVGPSIDSFAIFGPNLLTIEVLKLSKFRQRERDGTGYVVVVNGKKNLFVVFDHNLRDRVRKKVVVQVQELQAWHAQQMRR
jgi:hypothetical protein